MAEPFHPFRMVGPYGLVDAPKPLNSMYARHCYILMPNGKLFGEEASKEYVVSTPVDNLGNPIPEKAVKEIRPGRAGKVFHEDNAVAVCEEKISDHHRLIDEGTIYARRRIRPGDEWYHESLAPSEDIPVVAMTGVATAPGAASPKPTPAMIAAAEKNKAAIAESKVEEVKA